MPHAGRRLRARASRPASSTATSPTRSEQPARRLGPARAARTGPGRPATSPACPGWSPSTTRRRRRGSGSARTSTPTAPTATGPAASAPRSTPGTTRPSRRGDLIDGAVANAARAGRRAGDRPGRPGPVGRLPADDLAERRGADAAAGVERRRRGRGGRAPGVDRGPARLADGFDLARPSDRAVVKAGADVTVEARGHPRRGGRPAASSSSGGPTASVTRPPRLTGSSGRPRPPGSYALTARVRDDRGASADVGRRCWSPSSSRRRAEDREPDRVYLGDLPWSEASSGWGPVEKDRSNGERAPGDGGPIRLNGQAPREGAGRPRRLGGPLPARRASSPTFLAEVGVDDEVGDAGSVVFQVWADGDEALRQRPDDRPVAAAVGPRGRLRPRRADA